jgi:hypothetical protein
MTSKVIENPEKLKAAAKHGCAVETILHASDCRDVSLVGAALALARPKP